MLTLSYPLWKLCDDFVKQTFWALSFFLPVDVCATNPTFLGTIYSGVMTEFPLDILQVSAVVLLQMWAATLMQEARWPVIVAVAYCFGAFLNHNLFLAIHELSHNLAFSTPVYNRFLGLFANLPIGIPMSVTFQKYHLEHHRYQGVEGFDMDIPSYTEGHLVTNTFAKILWVVCQLFFYALRPLFLNPKTPGVWEVSNLIAQLSFDAALIYFMGWKALIYLVLSTFLGGGMHPIAGHFIAEHYVFLKGQETYSYYGPLNILAWNVGYHVEHHDFPRIPGCKLYRVTYLTLLLSSEFMWS